MRLATHSGLIATTLAIAAIATPSAQAGLFSAGPDPKGAAQQEAQSFLRIYSHPASTPSVATSDPATIARDQLGDRQLSAALLRMAQINGRNVATTATAPVASTTPNPGFQYGDAAVGGGLIAGLALLGTAGTLAVRRRGQLRHQ
jgi:hypothetical protein